MDRMCATLIFYLTPAEVDRFIDIFFPLLSHSLGSMRRAGAQSIAAICKNFPIAKHNETAAKLFALEQHDQSLVGNVNLIQGRLLCLLQLIKTLDPDATEGGSNCPHTPDLMQGQLPKIFGLINDAINHSDQNVVGACLELFQLFLAVYGAAYEIWDLVSGFLDTLFHQCFASDARVNTKAVALSCLSLVALHNAPLFKARFLVAGTGPTTAPEGDDEPLLRRRAALFLKHIDDGDPLLRGATAVFIGSLIAGLFACRDVAAVADLNILQYGDKLVDLLHDKSSQTAKMTCQAINLCLPYLLVESIQGPGQLALSYITSLLSLSPTAYWLVKQEVAMTLSCIDYSAVSFLEESKEQHLNSVFAGDDKFNVYLLRSQHTSHAPIQSRCIAFMMNLLSDEDARVRLAGSTALVKMIPRLKYHSQLDRAPSTQLAWPEAAFLHWPAELSSNGNLSHIIRELVFHAAAPHPPALLKGCYQALAMIARLYSFSRRPLYSPDDAMCRLSNPMCIFIGAVVPLAIDRICASSISSDLDSHLDVINVIGLLARESGAFFTPYATLVLRHLLRVINIMCSVLENRPMPAELRVANAQSYFSGSKAANPQLLGHFANLQSYLNLCTRLHGTYTTSLTSSSFQPDKFMQLRESCFKTLAVVIRNFGSKSIIHYNDEIISYLALHFEYEPKAVIMCMEALFYATFYQPNTAAFGQPAASPATLLSAAKVEEERDDLLNHWNFSDFTYTQDDVYILPKTDANQRLIRQFEPLVVCSVNEFQITHDPHIKVAVLCMLSQLVRFGIDFSRLDAKENFLTIIRNQMEQRDALVCEPEQLLPHIVEFLSVLLLIRHHQSKVITLDFLLQFVRSAFAPASNTNMTDATRNAIIMAARLLVKYAYPAKGSYDSGKAGTVQFREQFFKLLLQHVHNRCCLENLIIILHKSKCDPTYHHNYSKRILEVLLPHITAKSMKFSSFEDLQRLYAIFAEMSSTVVTQKEWEAALVSVTPQARAATVGQTPFLDEDLPRFEKRLAALGLHWLPYFVVMLHFGCHKKFWATAGAPSQKTVTCCIIDALEHASKGTQMGKTEHFLTLLRHLFHYVTKFLRTHPALLKTSVDCGRGHADRLDAVMAISLDCNDPTVVASMCSLMLAFSGDLASWKKASHYLAETSTSEHKREVSYHEYMIYHSVFLSYCKLLTILEAEVHLCSAVFVDNIIYHMSNQVTLDFIAHATKSPENQRFLLQRINDLLSLHPRISLTQRHNLLKCLTYVTSFSSDVLKLLFEHFVRSSANSLQIETEQHICKHLELIRASAKGANALALQDEFRALYAAFTRHAPPTYPYARVQSLFGSLVEQQQPRCPVPQPSEVTRLQAHEEMRTRARDACVLCTVPRVQLAEFIVNRFRKHAINPYKHLSLLLLCGRDKFVQLVSMHDLNLDLLPDFVSSPDSDTVKDLIADHISHEVIKYLQKQQETVSADSQGVWKWQLAICRCLLRYFQQEQPLQRSQQQGRQRPLRGDVVTGKHLGLYCIALLRQFGLRWGLTIGNPYDLLPILELTMVVAREDPELASSFVCALYQLYKEVFYPNNNQRVVINEPVEHELLKQMLVFLLGVVHKRHKTGSSLGKLVLDIFDATVLAVAQHLTALFYPALPETSADVTSSDEAAEGFDTSALVALEGLPITRQLYELDNPESTLRFLAFFFAGLTPQQFPQVFALLQKIASATSEADPDVTEQLKCHALQSLTTLILTLCLGEDSQAVGVGSGGGASSNRRFIQRKPQLRHVPRTHELRFLVEHPEVTAVQAIIDDAITRAETPFSAQHLHVPARVRACSEPLLQIVVEDEPEKDDFKAFIGLREVPMLHPLLRSPFHVNIERTIGENDLSVCQLSLVELRKFAAYSALVWR
eukprot:TRINITY_DN4668_c0_g1_i2.p1 TRINITY_DN4668_c0_g1~~TRINITY_DN4668_c0_g1_i2.p1  ORF type:complete len:2083 (+),score=517.27 TRINITY_DN4668_c0_g1_i2:594-6251(+)